MSMEISLINSNLQFSSSPSFHRFNNPISSLPTSSKNLLNHYHEGFRKNTISTKPQTNSLFRTYTTTTCYCSNTHMDTQISGTEVMDRDPSFEMKHKAMEISPELKGTSIFLVGMNSTVKTNLGKSLADALRYYYFDCDSLVEQAAGGEAAAKNFKESDEKGFRESETEVLKQLSSMGRLVVSTGDGAVQSSTNLSLLRYGISIWIDVPLELLAADIIQEAEQDPSTSDEVISKLTKVYEEMRNGYGTADGKISLQNVAYQLGYEDVSKVTTEDMGLEVLKELEKLTRVKKMMEAAARPF